MNYAEHYNKLVERSSRRELTGYSENHHIVPRCIGGADDTSNLVRLTAREHFVAHILLVKIYPKEYGLIKAVNMMCCSSKKHSKNRITNRMYSWLRKKHSEAISIQTKNTQKGVRNSQYNTFWICSIKLKENKKIKKGDNIDIGWVKGRNLWNSIDRDISKESRLNEKKLSTQIKQREKRNARIIKNIARDKEESVRKAYFLKSVHRYIDSDFTSINTFTQQDFDFSRIMFIKYCKKYFKDYSNEGNKIISKSTWKNYLVQVEN